MTLPDLVAAAFAAFDGVPAVKDARTDLESFIYERLRAYLRDAGYSANQIEAVLCQRPARIDLVPAQAAAVRAFSELPEADTLAAANKRIVNILRKSDSEAAVAVDRGRFADGAEHDLYLAFQKLQPIVDDRCAAGDFAGALLALATAKPAVDRFFDDVLVMADDPAIRANRLALLRGVAQTMNRVADISKLAAYAAMVQLASEAVAPTRAVKLIVLDRDGVINHDSDQFIKSPDEWRPIPGSLEAIARLNHAGFRVVVATNQSGIGRGLFDMGTLNAIHEKMHKALALAGGRVDAVFYCPHTGDSQCECRKPKTGMLREIGVRYGVDMTGVPCIGDSLRDLMAADAVGAQPMLVLTGKGEKTLRDGNFPEAYVIFPDLAFAASALLAGDE